MRLILLRKWCWNFLTLVLLVSIGTTLFSNTQAPDKFPAPKVSLTEGAHTVWLIHDDSPADSLLAVLFKTIETEVKESETNDSQDASATAFFTGLTANERSSCISPLSSPTAIVTPRLKFYLLFQSLKLDC